MVDEKTEGDPFAGTDPLAHTAVSGGTPSSTPRPFPSEEALVTGDVSIGAALSYGSFEERYAAGDLIGRGGMGEVRLFHDNLTGRDVAVKVIRQPEDDGALLASRTIRFLREARVQARLEHPSIVPVYDLGVSQGGAFFSMKRVRGTSLYQILEGLRRGDATTADRYSSRKLLNAFVRVCLAVDFAHERDVVHRDLKPDNIMLGDFGEVYVLDWGLAKETESDAVRVTLAPDEAERSVPGATRAGDLLGTPGYMAPEQTYGKARPVDGRADVYSLGAILFEILTHQPLNPGETALQRISATLIGEDRSPAARCPDAEIPPELDELCVHATTVLPEDRVPTARALAEAIEAFLDGARDAEMRRRLAEFHVGAAREHAVTALAGEGSLEARKEALAEVGKALALDPDEPAALQTLLDLLTTPPAADPPETDAEFQQMADDKFKMAARLGRWAILSWLVPVPFGLAMGVRDWTLGLTNIGLALLTILLVHVSQATEKPRLALQLLSVGCGALTLALATRVFGPMMLVPTAFVAFSLSVAMHEDRVRRLIFTGMQAVAWMTPVVLEALGVLSSSYEFRDGVMIVVPHVIELPEVGALTMLATAGVASIVAPAYYAGRLRDELTRAERRALTQVWQLRQLLPEAGREASSASLPRAFG